MPTEGVVQYAGVLDCMRMPAIEGLATLSWTLFYKGFVPSTRRAAAVQHNAARAHTYRVRACTTGTSRGGARAGARRVPEVHSHPSKSHLFAQSRQAPLPTSLNGDKAIFSSRRRNSAS